MQRPFRKYSIYFSFLFVALMLSNGLFAQADIYKKITGAWNFDHYLFTQKVPDSANLIQESTGSLLIFSEDSTYSTYKKVSGVDEEVSSGEFEISNDGKFMVLEDDSLPIIAISKNQLALTFDKKIILYFNKTDQLISPQKTLANSFIRDTTSFISESATSKIITLNNIIVSTKEVARSILLSDKKNRRKAKWQNLGFMAPDSEIAQSFSMPPTDFYYKIKKVSLPLLKRKCWGSITLHIYARHENDSLPSEELMKKKINVSGGIVRNGKISVDVSDENITLRGGERFYISLETTEIAEQPCMTGTMIRLTAIPNFLCRTATVDYNNWKTEVDMGFVTLDNHIENWHGQMFAEVEIEEYN